MNISLPPGHVAVPGFADHHAHLLKDAAGASFPPSPEAVARFHREVAAAGRTPMDVPDAEPDGAGSLSDRLLAALSRAAAAGLTEVTEMGMRSWAYLDALAALEATGPLPCRVRIYLASGLADEAGTAEIAARRSDCGRWSRLDGVKFYADGWLVPRTCAMCRDFADNQDRGVLFADAPTLARRFAPLAGQGWRIATHAIGDRAAETVLDAYELAFDGDRRAIAAAAPRIEHASVLSDTLIDRMAACGVTACIQPSFAVTDAVQIGPALGDERARLAYPWRALAAAGVPMLAGTDYPIEVLDPLPSLARLVSGRSDRPGFQTAHRAPDQALLPAITAVRLMSDPSSGQTLLTSDPRVLPPADIDQVQVLGTAPVPFS